MPKTKKDKNLKVVVQQIKSSFGKKPGQLETLKGLGLGKISRKKELILTPSTEGMIDKVRHLISVEYL